jgi:hypothetical protein
MRTAFRRRARAGRSRPAAVSAALVLVATALASPVAGSSAATAGTTDPASGTATTRGDVTAQANSWHHRDLTAELGAPTGYGDIVAFPVAGTDSRVYYVGIDSHVHELSYWQGGWHHSDLTARTGAPASKRSALAGFAMNGMEPRLYYGGYDNHVYELSYSEGRWRYRDLTAAAGAPAVGAVARIAAFQAAETDPRVYYLTSGQSHVHELAHWGGGWHHRDLTVRTGAPAARCCELVGFTAGGPDSRVYFLDWAKHVHELSYWQGGWHRRDLTARTGARPAWSGALAGFTVGGADSRVYYADDVTEHLHELSYWQGGWHRRDLSTTVGAPYYSGTDDIAGFPTGNGGGSRVYTKNFRDGHIYEYAFYQGDWHYRDVSDAADAPPWSGAGEIAAFLVNGTDSRVYYQSNGRINELAEYDDSPEPPGPQTRTVGLQRQMVWEGFIPYLGQFPPFGVVSPGRLLQIHVPQVGLVDRTVYFVKPGRSTTECDDPSAVVAVDEGRSTTPSQMSAIFGQAEPRFSTSQPLAFVACIGSAAGEAPFWMDIEITVQFD